MSESRRPHPSRRLHPSRRPRPERDSAARRSAAEQPTTPGGSSGRGSARRSSAAASGRPARPAKSTGSAKSTRTPTTARTAKTARPAKTRPAKTRPAKTRPAQTARPAKSTRTPKPARPPRTPRPRRGPLRLRLGQSTRRIRVVLIAMAVLVSLCAGRLFQLQALDSAAYAQSAAEKMQYSMTLHAARGTITDRNGLVLARSEPAVNVTADPSHTNPVCEDGESGPCGTTVARSIAEVLVRHLGGTTADYLPNLTRSGTRFVYLKKKVPAATYQRLAIELSDLDLYGVFRESNPIRSYPGGDVAANVVGFVNAANEGAAGFEYSMDAELAGVPGEEVYERDKFGNKIPLGTQELTPAVDGTGYQLTIDSELQWAAEHRLAQQVESSRAESGTAVVMNVRTGEVLAMANYPGFDAAQPGAADPEDLGNRAVTHALEPGSVQKVLTFGALLDRGLITPDTRVTLPERVPSGDGYITDSDGRLAGMRLTATGVLAKSSNTGTVMLTRDMSPEQLIDYYRSFGLGAPTGIELPGEAAGYLPEADMEQYTMDQISFGQGLSMTPIQFTAAVAGLLNGGVYNPPTIIASATGTDGDPVAVEHGEPRRVISEQASRQLAMMLEAVTSDGGTGSSVAIEGYRTGGKTATAERIDPTCGCYRGYTSGYVGVAPAEDPQIVTFVQIDKPQKGRYGVTIAGPAYKDITQLALQRYGIQPSDGEPYQGELTW